MVDKVFKIAIYGSMKAIKNYIQFNVGMVYGKIQGFLIVKLRRKEKTYE